MRQLDQANPWTILRREEKFTCSFFSVRSDTVQFGASRPRIYNSIRMKSIGVTIAPIDDEGCTTLVGQYRYVLDRFTWELPAGGCRLDQAPVEAAKIELSEETGYRAANWLRLFDCAVAPGSIDGRTQCFVAWSLQPALPTLSPRSNWCNAVCHLPSRFRWLCLGKFHILRALACFWAFKPN